MSLGAEELQPQVDIPKEFGQVIDYGIRGAVMAQDLFVMRYLKRLALEGGVMCPGREARSEQTSIHRRS